MRFSLKALLTIMLAGSSLNLYAALSPVEDRITAELDKKSIIRSYFDALEAKSYESIITLFDTAAVVHSPLLGTKNASDFYQGLFAKTNTSPVTLLGIYTNEEAPNTVLAHFVCDWKLSSGAAAPFECVDIFEFSATNLILSLKIIYDSHPLREAFKTVETSE